MRRLLLSPALLISATAAQAQISWLNPVSGDWTNPANWAGSNVPDNGGEVAQIGVAGTYAVDYAANFQVGGLQLTNANATLNITPNVTFAIGGNNWTNNGLVVLNKTASALATYLRTDVGALTFNGNGTLRLNAEPSNLDTAQLNTNNGGFVITNSATHSVKGCGNLRIAMDNQGLFEADQAGKTLQLAQLGKSNTGTMRATNGGTLQINGINVNNVGGQIVANNGSTVNVLGSGISGGTSAGVGTGVVRLVNSTYSDVTLTGAHNVIENSTFALGGSGVTNNGILTLNSAGAALGTFLRTDVGAATIGGNGTLRLNAHPSNLDTAQVNTNNGGFVLTNGPDHTISGIGRIRIAMINEGEIRADGTAEFIDLNQISKTNNNLIEATGGGVVQVNGIGLTNSEDGQIVADGAGSVASYFGSGISGGTLVAQNGGVGSITNSTFSDLTVTGPHQVNANSTLFIGGTGFTNDGTITINPTAGNLATYLYLNVAAAAIDGAGTIQLNAEPSNLDTAQVSTPNGNYILTLGANQTVRGRGAIRVNTVNNGLIDANDSGHAIALRQLPKTNNATMRATNGGVLSIEGIGVTNNGQIVADGADSVVSYFGGGISGGTLVAQNGGVGSITNSTFSDLNVTGPHQVNANSSLFIGGTGFTNDGTITINPTAGNLATYLYLNVAEATIDGAGTIQLNAEPSNLDTAQVSTPNGAYVLTLGANQTVRGRGAIRVNTVNNGLIDADDSGRAIVLRQLPKTNNATMRATNGGTLGFEGVGVTNNGQIVADGVGSVVSYFGGGISGGTLVARNGGVGSITNCTFSNLTVTGPHHVNANSTLYIGGTGFTNDGTITINHTAGNLTTYLYLNVAAATIDGSGTIELNAHPNNLDTAQLGTPNGSYVLTFGPDQSLTGTGAIRVRVDHQGRLSPGTDAAPIGRIEARQFPFTMSTTSSYTATIGGVAPGEFDTFAAASSATLDGNVIVHTINGFVPVRGDEFAIVTANPRIGEFDRIVAPPIDADSVWRIRYTPTQAILSVTCPGDIDGDHIIELPDLATLLSNYGTPSDAQGFEGDADGDGDIDLVDLALVLIGFGAPCP